MKPEEIKVGKLYRVLSQIPGCSDKRAAPGDIIMIVQVQWDEATIFGWRGREAMVKLAGLSGCIEPLKESAP